MTNTMTIHEIREAILNDTFKVPYQSRPKLVKEGFVFDEDKSVKWNKEEAIRVNAKLQADYDEYKAAVNQAQSDQDKAIIQGFACEYGLSEAKVSAAFSYAYSESHSSGMYDVLLTLEEVLDLYVQMNSMD